MFLKRMRRWKEMCEKICGERIPVARNNSCGANKVAHCSGDV